MIHSHVAKLATTLSWIITGCSGFLLMVVGLSVLARAKSASDFVRDLAYTTALGAGFVWPGFVLLAMAVAVALVLAIIRSSVRRRRHSAATALAIIALGVTWAAGVRPPAARVDVFHGIYAVDPLNFSADMLFPCEDSANPLPRGAQLGWAGSIDTPLVVAIPVPDRGWHGTRPNDWPDTYSDVHGVPYYRVELRGTLIGPGQYGWPPVAQYRLDVDSVVSVRPRRRHDELEC